MCVCVRVMFSVCVCACVRVCSAHAYVCISKYGPWESFPQPPNIRHLSNIWQQIWYYYMDTTRWPNTSSPKSILTFSELYP